MQILLDTNFILTCVKQKIYFDVVADELFDEEIEWIIPQEVLNELGNLKDRVGMKNCDRDAAKLSFDILKHLKHKIVILDKNPNVDIAIVNFILGKPIVLATLDKNLKSRIDNKILTIKGKKNLQIIE